MITLVEALNYRCLRDVSRPMDRFHVLVGPNASGKTTLLDTVAFLSDLVRNGLHAAIDARSPTFHDLLFRQQGGEFQLAVEASLPDKLRSAREENLYNRIRYEVAVHFHEDSQSVVLEKENLYVKATLSPPPLQRELFPQMRLPRDSLIRRTVSRREGRRILTRTLTGRANYYSETYREPGKGWNPQWDLVPGATALANLPADESKFPIATWFRTFLTQGIESIQLDSLAMRQPSPPGQGLKIQRDGSNLPWVVESLKQRQPNRFNDWIDHLRTALPELESIRTVEREEDRHRYIKVCYQGGFEVPSWLVSDGTLRLLALTLTAYLDNLSGVLLIEEPENGIHPRAVETLFESLSNVYGAQVLLATHSPVILSIAEPPQVLCFAKDEAGATDIVSGEEHPRLADWQHGVPLGDLFAAGVLG